MLCACTCYSASADLAAIRDVLAKSRDIFVVNVSDLVTAEAAWLLLKFLIERWRNFWFLLQRPVGTCSHCGAPCSGPAFLRRNG